MTLSREIIANLLEAISVDDVADEIVKTYYDKTNKKFNDDLDKIVSEFVDNEEDKQKVIDKVNSITDTQKQDDSVEDNTKNLDKDVQDTGNKIVGILNNYGVKTKFVNAEVGSSITQYEFELEAGTKISEVENLSKEIALGIPCKSVVVKPVESKTTIGIQVPNETTTPVNLKDIEDTTDNKGVTVALGKDMNGKTVSADILQLQHVLIGGSTGSGKSACINSMICSLIQKYSPEQVKLILIDPKRVEFSVYKNLPHLLMPIITSPEQASDTLDNLCKEMDRRYSTFEKTGVKNIESYNALVGKYNESNDEKVGIMPYIVVVIDELADLMTVAGKSVEKSIQRLTQLARASGIHLIVATQRPSSDVITGVIKANIPSRIAFTTASGMDSRTILDTSGAEKLMGKGDMLYKPVGATNTTRVQGAYIDDDEIEDIVNKVCKDNNVENKSSTPKEETKETSKSNYDKALDIIRDEKRISTSLLQLRLGIDYSEAREIIQQLEDNGLIQKQKGNKGRKVNK